MENRLNKTNQAKSQKINNVFLQPNKQPEPGSDMSSFNKVSKTEELVEVNSGIKSLKEMILQNQHSSSPL